MRPLGLEFWPRADLVGVRKEYQKHLVGLVTILPGDGCLVVFYSFSLAPFVSVLDPV